MNTRTRAEILAKAASAFPFLGPLDADALCELVRLELGDACVLDEFRPRGQGYARAFPLSPILHIVSGNTPHAALQSLLRGLLLGANNRIKLPSCGLPEVEHFFNLLPPELLHLVECRNSLPDSWISQAAAVVGFGSDDTLAAVHTRLRQDQVFIPHGHRLSFGVIYEDPLWQSVPLAARDASLFDQQGCLSPHLYYLADHGLVEEYANRLALAMEAFEQTSPRSRVSPEEAAVIQNAREEWNIKSLTQPGVVVHASKNSTAWTVIVDPSPDFRISVLNRFIFVKPLPADLHPVLLPVTKWLSTAALFPCTMEYAQDLVAQRVPRLCPVGSMQDPSPLWHPDGSAPLVPLVRWIDFEPPSVPRILPAPPV